MGNKCNKKKTLSVRKLKKSRLSNLTMKTVANINKEISEEQSHMQDNSESMLSQSYNAFEELHRSTVTSTFSETTNINKQITGEQSNVTDNEVEMLAPALSDNNIMVFEELQEETITPAFVASAEDVSYLIEAEIAEDQSKISGRRIVDVVYFINQLQQLNHDSLFSCGFSDLIMIAENRTGLTSQFKFKCKICMKIFRVRTNKQDCADEINVNTAAVSGIVSSGIGYSQFEESMSAMNIPIFCENFYAKIQNGIFDEWESSALEIMARAATREYQAAVKEGRLFNNIPVIDVYADGAWSKRSYGNNYSAMSGIAAIVGRKYGEVLFIGVKNKYCLICAKAEKRKVCPKEHKCYKNYEGPSSGMEAAIICEVFKSSIETYGLIYGTLVADGDSATYAKILASNPYPGYVVTKLECRNHILRNMCNKMRAISKDMKYPLAHRKLISNEKIMSVRKVVTLSIKFNKEYPKDVGIKQLQDDLSNALNHSFGDHRFCKIHYCNKEKVILASSATLLEHTSVWFRLKVIINTVISKSRSLLEDVDTNAVERFNSIVAKFVGGKRINYTTRRSYQSRCLAAVVSYNTKKPLNTLHKKILGKSPKGILKKIEEKKEKKRAQANAIKRKKNRCKRSLLKQFEYGQKVTAPDMPEDMYKVALDNFLANLKELVSDRKGIQQRTTLQRESSEWAQIRRLLITASNFGAIIKRKKKFGRLVSNILYKKNLSSVASVAHGVQNEKFALQQLSTQENVQIADCGLFVDEEFAFIGATPDGVVDDDTIVEVKCPVAAFRIGVEEAIKLNKVQILKHNKKNGQVTINKNSNWYYQVQGQLHIAKKQTCIFGIWGGENRRVEVLYIHRDDLFWKTKMEPKLIEFYYKHMLPELVDSRRDRGMPLRDFGD